MKCLITKEETSNKTKNLPISRKGRVAIKEYIQEVADLATETGMPFRTTITGAMVDLIQGYSIVDNHRTKMTEAKAKSEETEDVK